MVQPIMGQPIGLFQILNHKTSLIPQVTEWKWHREIKQERFNYASCKHISKRDA